MPPRTLTLALLAAVLACPPFERPAAAKPPTLTSLYPAGARQGTTTLVAATGAVDPWPVRGWVSGSGVALEPSPEKGKFWVIVADDAPAGLHWVRLYNPDGSSSLRPFLVGTLPEVSEREPNDDPKRPQSLECDAVTVNGKLARNGDVDGFSVRLGRGQTLVASVEANRRLGSPMDGVLQVVNPAGFVVAHNDDDRDRDPQITFEAPAEGTYLVRVFAFPATPDSRIGFSGGDTYVYRLTVTTRGFLDHAFPLALTGGTSTGVLAEGWNLEGSDRSLAVDADRDAAADTVTVADRHLGHEAEVRVVPHATAVESEPNPASSPQSVTPPVTVSGRIGDDDDSDVYRFPARKGVRLSFRVESRALGFALDPTLRLTDAGGKTIEDVDDPASGRGRGRGRNRGQNDSRDPEVEFNPPSDGDYRVAVRDLNGQGGPRQLYRLSIVPVAPDFALSLASDQFTLTPGKPLKVKVAVDRRNGFDLPLRVEAVGLPPGLTSAPVTSPPKGDSAATVELTFDAVAGARAGPFRIVGRSEGVPNLIHTGEVIIDGFSARTVDLWLNVAPQK